MEGLFQNQQKLHRERVSKRKSANPEQTKFESCREDLGAAMVLRAHSLCLSLFFKWSFKPCLPVKCWYFIICKKSPTSLFVGNQLLLLSSSRVILDVKNLGCMLCLHIITKPCWPRFAICNRSKQMWKSTSDMEKTKPQRWDT